MATTFDDTTLTNVDFDGPLTPRNPEALTALEAIGAAVLARIKLSALDTATTLGGVSASDAKVASQKAVKAYIDALVTGGVTNWKDACACATTAALPACTYNNGAGTLTGNSNGALTAQDGVTPTSGMRILVKNQASAFQNGPYTVTTVGDGSNAFVLTRTTDADTAAEVTKGAAVLVSGGTTLAGTQWFVNSTVTTLGTDSITWVQTTAAAAVTDGSITFAKFQDIATNKLVGRDASGTGDAAEIGVTNGLEFTGSDSIGIATGAIDHEGARMLKPLKRYRSLTDWYGCPPAAPDRDTTADATIECGATIQTAINECWAEGRELYIPPTGFITNQALATPEGADAAGVLGRIVGMGCAEYEHRYAYSSSNAPYNGALSGSCIIAGPSFPRGATVLTMRAANWGSSFEAFGILGRFRAARCFHMGSGRSKIREVQAGDIATKNLGGTFTPVDFNGLADGLGAWCILARPIALAGGTYADGTNGEGYMGVNGHDLRMAPGYVQASNYDGDYGGLAVTGYGGESMTDGEWQEIRLRSWYNQESSGRAIGLWFGSGAGGSSVHDYHASTGINNNDGTEDSNVFGALIEVGNFHGSKFYLDAQGLGAGAGSAYLRCVGDRIVIDGIRIIMNTWSTSPAGKGIISVDSAFAGILNDISFDCDATTLPATLVKIQSATGTTQTPTSAFKAIIDKVISDNQPWAGITTGPRFGVHNDTGTMTSTGDRYDGRTSWSTGGRLHWNNVLAAG